MKKWILGLGSFLLLVGLAILGRDSRALRRTEAQRDELLATGANEHKKKAEALNRKAEKKKQAAKEAAAATQARLEKISEKDPDMDDLLSAWQSERVRQQSS
jgi:hypothetical protein